MSGKRIIFFVFLSFVLLSKAFSQFRPSPGGVKNPVTWYITDSAARVPTYHSVTHRTDSLLSLPGGQSYHLLNFHPSIFFSGNDTLSIALPDSSMSSSSFFAVYQSTKPGDESTIWHTFKQGQTEIVSTTKRVGDLETISYMNFTDVVPQNAKVGIYMQQKLKETYFPLRQFWKVGYKPTFPILPVQSFTGLMPEIIAYKRVLTGTERLQVASYLAIKYGITLSDTKAVYLNSTGDILWDGLNYTDYHHNIAGIGRDDTSALVQLKSTSSNQPSLLTISTPKLRHNDFLLWGDNDKPLSVGTGTDGMPPMLQKKWMMAAHGGGQNLTTDILLDTKLIDMHLPSQPVYWLVVDRSGTGDYPNDKTEFIRMSDLDQNGFARFANVSWGLNGNNREVMSIYVGGELIAATKVIAPLCNEPASGTIKIKITGGRAPYHVTITKTEGASVLDASFANRDTITVNRIEAGKYLLSVQDAAGQRYSASFYVNNNDGPKPMSVSSAYNIPQGSPLIIRADSLMSSGVIYSWTGPGGFRSDGAEVHITQPGLYTLTCTRDGCRYQQDVLVSAPPVGRFVSIRAYPNPSSGSYTATVTLDHPAPIHMAVYTISGNLVGSADSNGLANYQFNGTINMAGTYMIKFTSGSYVASWKEIIVN